MLPSTVLLYGASLLLSLVAASLNCYPDLRVTHVMTWGEASRALKEQIPDVIIFDLTDNHEGHILPLLLKNPHLLLIGLDPENNQGLLLSGQDAHSLTLDQIREMIGGRR